MSGEQLGTVHATLIKQMVADEYTCPLVNTFLPLLLHSHPKNFHRQSSDPVIKYTIVIPFRREDGQLNCSSMVTMGNLQLYPKNQLFGRPQCNWDLMLSAQRRLKASNQ